MKKNYLLLLFAIITTVSIAQSPLFNWSSIQSFPGGGRYGAYAFVINGKAYAGLGIDTNSNKPLDWYEYDTVSAIWTQKQNFPGNGRWTGSSFVINGKGYIACGATTGSPSNVSELWQYDPVADTWTQKAVMPGTPRQNSIAFAVGGYGYVGTGFSNGSVVKDMWRYDPAGNSWTSVADFPGQARDGASAFAIGAYGYVGIGCDVNGTSFFSDFYKYDPSANTWSAIAAFPNGILNNASAMDFGGYAYVVSGIHNGLSTGKYSVKSVYQYDPSVDHWTEVLDSFSGIGTGYGVGFVLGNRMYYGSGSPDGGTATEVKGFWKTSVLPSKGALAINDVKDDAQECKYYPNPFTRELFTAIPANTDAAFSIRVYDIFGRLVADDLHILNNGRIDYDLSVLSAGAYTLESTNAKNHQSIRIKMVKE